MCLVIEMGENLCVKSFTRCIKVEVRLIIYSYDFSDSILHLALTNMNPLFPQTCPPVPTNF